MQEIETHISFSLCYLCVKEQFVLNLSDVIFKEKERTMTLGYVTEAFRIKESKVIWLKEDPCWLMDYMKVASENTQNTLHTVRLKIAYISQMQITLMLPNTIAGYILKYIMLWYFIWTHIKVQLENIILSR